MRKTTLLPLLTLLALRTAAQYSTPGTGQRYTLAQLAAASGGYVAAAAGGTWLITDTIRLAATDTLSITTNEVIRVAARALVSVDGVLRLTPPDSVLLTAQDPAAPWVGLQLSSTAAGSVLRRTVVAHSGGLRVLDAAVELTDCTLRQNVATVGGRPSNSAALSLSGSAALVQRCRFVRNARAGVGSPANRPTSPSILDCVFWENGSENGNYPQINLGVGSPAAPIRIERCLIVGRAANTMAGGIGLANLLGGAGVTTAVLRRNTVRGNRYGIAVIGSNLNVHVVGNVLENNNINPNAQTGGSGLNFQGNQTQTGVVARNVVTGNLWGVTLVRSGTGGGPRISFGDATSTDTTDVGRNRFVGNGNGGQVYDFYNNGPDNVKAQLNDWGTASAATIEAHIFHQPDQATLGVVDFQPFRQPLRAPTAAPRALAAYPNPARETVMLRIKNTAPVQVFVMDVAGRLVRKQTLQPVNGAVWLGVHGLPPGPYQCQLLQAGELTVSKLVVE